MQPKRSTVPSGGFPSLRVLTGTALGVTLANFGAIHTAEAQAPAPATPSDASSTQLPTVSVQGQQGSSADNYKVNLPDFGKLTAPLLDTPQSIHEIPRALLDDQGVTTMRDALRNVPGVSLAAGEGGQQGDNLSIRGFNAQNDFYLDGMRDFGSYYRDPFDLERIEVLEGPASIMFGRGSTGGAINQVSKQAQLAPITAGTVSIGTDGTYRFTTDTNRAIDGLKGSAIRLNVMGNLNGTAGRDIAESRRLGVAPSLVFGLGTDTRLSFNYLHEQAYDTPDYGIPWINGAPAAVGHRNFYGYKDSDYFRTNVDIVTGKLEHDFGDAITVTDQLRYGSYSRALRVTEPQLRGYNATNNVVLPMRPLESLNITRNNIALTSRETILDNDLHGTFRFDTGPLHHTAIAGFEVSHQTSDPTRYTYGTTLTNILYPQLLNNVPAGVTNTIAGTKVDNGAVYAFDTMNVGPYIDLVGGWRWDRFDSTFHQTTVATNAKLNLKRDDDLPSYRGAIVFKPTDYGSIYFSYGTSFNPSAESLSLTAATATVAPEKTTSYEVGTKWDLLDRRLSLTGALYQVEKANVREVDPNNALADILAGDYRVRGFTLGATGHLTQAWQVTLGYSYNDAIVASSPNPLEVGHTPPNAPRHTVTAWTEYTLPWHNIELGGGVNYVSSRTASSTPLAGTNYIETAPGYWTMSLMAKYPITPNMSIQANVTNVTNTYYYDSLHPSHIILGAQRAALFTLAVKL